MKEKLEKKLFNKLIEYYGFVVEQYINPINSESTWAALKYTKEGVISVICTLEAEEEAEVKGLIQYLYSKNQPFNINVVVLTGETDGYNLQEHNYNRIEVDKYSNKVLRYPQASEFIANILNENSSRRKINKKTSKITLILMAVNIAVFIATAILSKDIFDINTLVLYAFGAKENYAIAHGEYYRLLTAAFLHGGIMHLALNMYALYILGDLIEEVYGKTKYVAIYIISAVASSYLSYRMSPSLSIGASGAIFGLMGAALIYAFKERNSIGKYFLRNILSVIALNVFIGLTMSNIDNYGHFGGLLGGMLISFLLYPSKYKR
ncbi:rhomboid family intramembrane serine protease [Clostridium polynesiense]|uniref:rhomboid family intramembrane serine protease n=1 Tax=Clostridium polynesiense TaxID=1325933 RepID=UPI0005914E23|nr:rhomboid family intramembrane serine protease [Clostridium polynesiense]